MRFLENYVPMTYDYLFDFRSERFLDSRCGMESQQDPLQWPVRSGFSRASSLDIFLLLPTVSLIKFKRIGKAFFGQAELTLISFETDFWLESRRSKWRRRQCTRTKPSTPNCVGLKYAWLIDKRWSAAICTRHYPVQPSRPNHMQAAFKMTLHSMRCSS